MHGFLFTCPQMNYIHCFSPDELLSTISSSYVNDIVVYTLTKYLSSLIIPYIFVDYVGYVHDVSPTKMNHNSNPFLDIKLKTSPQQVNTIRIMTNNAPKRQLFVDKKISSQPVRSPISTKLPVVLASSIQTEAVDLKMFRVFLSSTLTISTHQLLT